MSEFALFADLLREVDRRTKKALREWRLNLAQTTGLLSGSSVTPSSTSDPGVVVLAPSGGTTSGTVVQASDPRLSDARTPTAHASTHAAAGSDPLTLSESQITNLVSDLAAKQPLDATLTAIAALTTAADKLIYATGADAFATTDLSSFIRTLLDDADAATARGTLGLGTAATAASTDFVSAVTTRSANTVLAGPTSGAAAAPTFRALVADDIPGTLRIVAINPAGNVAFNLSALGANLTEMILGGQASGDRGARIALVSDATNAYGFRVLREEGVNGLTALQHHGTGVFQLTAHEAAAIEMYTNNVLRAMIDSAGKVGIATSTPRYALDVIDTTTFTPIRFGSANADNGGFLISSAAGQAILSGGAAFDGTNWRARHTGATLVHAASGDFQVLTDKSLTVGNTFTPTIRFSIDELGATIIKVTDAGTTNQPLGLTIAHSTSGTPAVNFGVDLLFNLESASVDNRNAALIEATWATATDASRKARMRLYVYDTAAREAIRIEANGSAAMIGFLGAAAQAKPTVTGIRASNTALASLLTALANYGLITDSTTAT